MLDTIARCARGESRLSTEITGDVVAELSLHLDRAGVADEAKRDQIPRIRGVLDGSGPEIVFQPIVDLDSSLVVVYEALSRFADSEPPDRWFADADLVGLRAELELQAAGAALRYLDDLPPASLLSINISPHILGVELCQRLGKRAGRVVFELTEHTAVEDYDALAGVLSDLRLQGARIAVDDVGAGFASLRHILQLGPGDPSSSSSTRR